MTEKQARRRADVRFGAAVARWQRWAASADVPEDLTDRVGAAWDDGGDLPNTPATHALAALAGELIVEYGRSVRAGDAAVNEFQFARLLAGRIVSAARQAVIDDLV